MITNTHGKKILIIAHIMILNILHFLVHILERFWRSIHTQQLVRVHVANSTWPVELPPLLVLEEEK